MNFKTTLQILGYIIVIVIALIALRLLSEFDYQNRKSNAPQWELHWSDEFNYNGMPADSLWQFDLGDGCPSLCGWGNNELQYYTQDSLNVRVSNGLLIIEALKDSVSPKGYTSARIKSKAPYDIKYGKIDIRLKNPEGKGVWPAVWMLPTKNFYGQWPKSGEIDIMEHVGYNPDSIFGTVHTEAYNHTKSTQKSGSFYLPSNETSFHTYSMEWSSEKIDLFIDNQKYFTFKDDNKSYKEWPFSKDFQLIMNVAVGGDWGGKMGVNPELNNMKMEVDYVRVYRDNSPQRVF